MTAPFAIKPIVPDTFGLDPKRIRDLLDDQYATEAQEVVKDYQHVTSTWRRKPEFKIVVKSDGISREVVTDDERVGWTDRGTRPHGIAARRRRNLIFALGGQPKSQPGMFAAYAGRPGTDWRAKRAVKHPGTRPRRWSETIQERSRNRLWKRTTQAINDLEKRAGGKR